MPFEQYLSELIAYTEDRALVMSRQSEAWSSFCQASTVQFTGEFLISLGMPAKPKDQRYPNF